MAEVLNVWIGNLGKYTEGKLEGEWVSLPCSKEKLEQVYEKIGMENYVNFEAIGRDAQLSGDVDLYENGYYEAAGGGPDLGCYSKEDLLTMSGLSEPDMEKEVQMEENAPRL